MVRVARKLGYCAGMGGNARPPALGKIVADRSSSFISLAETVTHCTSPSFSAGVFDPDDFAWIPLAGSSYDLSPIDSAKSHDDNRTSAAPTTSSSAPRDVAAASPPGTSSHVSLASSISVISVEDATVPEKQATSSIYASFTSSKAGKHREEMEALYALRDKFQAALSAHRAGVAARPPLLQTAGEPACFSRTEHRAPDAMSDADISEEAVHPGIASRRAQQVAHGDGDFPGQTNAIEGGAHAAGGRDASALPLLAPRGARHSPAPFLPPGRLVLRLG